MLNFGFFCRFILPTILGLLDITSDIFYIIFESFFHNSLFLACFYCQFSLFFGSLIFYIYFHFKDESSRQMSIFRIILRSFELTILTELKLAHFIPAIWDLDEDPEFDFNNDFRMKIVSIQEIFHTFLQAIPQIFIQLINNLYLGQWNMLSCFSLFLSGIFLMKILWKVVLCVFYRGKNKFSEGIYMEI